MLSAVLAQPPCTVQVDRKECQKTSFRISSIPSHQLMIKKPSPFSSTKRRSVLTSLSPRNSGRSGFCRASPEALKQFRVKSGDLLVCEGGEAGRAGIVDSAPVTCIMQNSLHRVRKKGADVRFLQYVLQMVSSEGWFDVLCNKSTIAHFTREKLANLRMPLPPSLEEQRAIASFLDRETARIDALIEKVKKSIELL